MMGLARAWRGISLGVFLLAVGVLLMMPWRWQWIFVVICGSSAVNAILKGSWRWLPHPVMWGVGLGFSYATGTVGGWAMFWMLCGLSIILGYLIGLVPRAAPKEPHRAPGARVVLDAEMVSRSSPDEPPA